MFSRLCPLRYSAFPLSSSCLSSTLRRCHIPACLSQRECFSPRLTPKIPTVLWRFHVPMTVKAPVEFPPSSLVTFMSAEQSTLYTRMLPPGEPSADSDLPVRSSCPRPLQCQTGPAVYKPQLGAEV